MLLVAIAVAIGIGIAAAVLKNLAVLREAHRLHHAFHEALETHSRRRRAVSGCMRCAREIPAPIPLTLGSAADASQGSTSTSAARLLGRLRALLALKHKLVDLFSVWLFPSAFPPRARSHAAEPVERPISCKFVCGSCPEDWSLCPECFHALVDGADGADVGGDADVGGGGGGGGGAASASSLSLSSPAWERAHREGHPLRAELVDLEVDVEGIKLAAAASGRAPEAVRSCFDAYWYRWLLGERLVPGNKGFSRGLRARHWQQVEELSGGGGAPGFTWLTYGEVCQAATALFLGLAQECGLRPGDFLVLQGASSPEWYVTYFAALLHGVVLVPAQASASNIQIEHIVRTTKARAFVASSHLQLPGGIADETAVVRFWDSAERYGGSTQDAAPGGDASPADATDTDDLSDWERIVHTGWKILDSQPEKGAALLGDTVRSMEASDDSTTRLLLSSSGTTGLPKLIIVSDEMLRQLCVPPRQGSPTIMLSIEPLRQSLDLLAKGGRVGLFTRLDLIREDLQLVNPTIFGSTPAFFLGLMQEFTVELEDRIEASEVPTGAGLSAEDALEKRDRDARYAAIKDWQSRAILGNRCRSVIVGGAVSSQELRDFLFDVLRAVVTDGYGSTETGAVAANGVVHDGIKMILVDAPEYGYLTSDDPPRGEIVVSTARMTPGYFGDEAATARQFVEMGGSRYARTGDVGRMIDGRVEVIDRIVSLFKLRTGVFVAPAELEVLFEQSSSAARVFIWGTSAMHRVAAAVLIPEHLQKEEPTQVIETLRRDFAQLAQEEQLAGSLIPRTIHVDTQPWTTESGLVNGAGKPVRAALIAKFRPFLQDSEGSAADNSGSERMLEEAGRPESAVSSDGTSLMSGLQKLIRECIPDGDSLTLSANTMLRELGADSLSFARLVRSARKRFGSAITLPQLMRCQTLGEVQRALFGDLPDAQPLDDPSFWDAEVNGALEQLRSLIDDLESSARVSFSSSKAPPAVLLTGACGFLGAFLLDSLCRRNIFVVCVVRAASHSAAAERVRRTAKDFQLIHFLLFSQELLIALIITQLNSYSRIDH